MNLNKTISLILIIGLVLCFCIPAESISVKLRGKLTLAGILAGLTYATYTLVRIDRHTAQELQFQLGTPQRIIQFERGFEKWSVNYYQDHFYMFLNNRFIRKKAYSTSSLMEQSSVTSDYNFSRNDFSDRQEFSIYINMPSSVNPKWLSPFLWHQQLILTPVSSDLHLLEDVHSLHRRLPLSHLKSQK